MQQASSTRIIQASPARVWEIIADVTSIERWHPSVASADLLSDRRTGIGAARRCNFHDGTHVREDVIAEEAGHVNDARDPRKSGE